MARAFKRGDSWYVDVRDGRGARIRVSTTATNKLQAEKILRDLDHQYERQRLGLEALPAADGGETVAELLSWWLTNYSERTPSHASNTYVVDKHLMGSTLAETPAAKLTATAVEAFLDGKADELAPQSLNHLRSFLSRAYGCAIRTGRFVGANPIATVTKRRIAKRPPSFLTVEEVPRVLDALDPRWRPLFATAIYTGMRRGELFALHKVDVDLTAKRITVCRSGDRDTTKGGHSDVIPIAAELVPFLAGAIAASAYDLVFPLPKGKYKHEPPDLPQILRRAMARAGIVTGYLHICRRKGCDYSVDAPDDGERHCPNHNKAPGPTLWAKAKVRPIRFHSLRHTTASLLLMAGADLVAVQRIMRHASPEMTSETYGHLTQAYLQTAVDRLHFGLQPPPEPEPDRKPLALVANGHGTIQAQSDFDGPSRDSGSQKRVVSDCGEKGILAGWTGLEPAPSGVTGRRYNQLNYHPAVFRRMRLVANPPRPGQVKPSSVVF